MKIQIPSLLNFKSNELIVRYNGATLTAPQLVLRPEKKMIEIQNVADVTSSNIAVELENLINHPWSSSSGNFVTNIWANGTNTILFEGSSSAPSVISQVISSASSETLLITNFEASSYILTVGDTVHYEIQFRIENSLPANNMIRVEIPIDFDVKRCWLIENVVDLNALNLITCTITGTPATGQILTYTNLAAVFQKTKIKIGLKAVNPLVAPGGPSWRIQTWYDTTMTKLVDSSDLFEVNFDPTYTLIPNMAVDNLILMQSNSFISLAVNFETGVGYSAANRMTLTVRLNKNFAAKGTGMTCQLFSNAVATITVPCAHTFTPDQEIVIIITDVANTYAVGLNHRLVITGTNPNGLFSPLYANEYQVEMTLTGSVSGAEHATGLATIVEKSLDNSLITIQPYTLDFDHITVYDISFYIPFKFERSSWFPRSNEGSSYIEISFPTAAGAENLFKVDLGTGKATGSDMPCYGVLLLNKFEDQTDNELSCTLTRAAAVGAGNNVIIRIGGYDPISKEDLVRLHIPGIFNPISQISAATILIDGYRVFHQKTTKVFSGSKAMSLTVPYNIADNMNNFNGGLSQPSNQSPLFSPDLIFESSTMEIKFTPNRTMAIGSGFLLFAPPLPNTTPPSYLFPKQNRIDCEVTGTPIDCYSYPKANILVFANMPKVIAPFDEVTFKVNNFLNPSYVVNLQKSMELWTYTNAFREDERVLYKNLPPFGFGKINRAYVLPYRYQALNIAVTYDWIFVNSNEIPQNGKIVLYFPANYYDLESSSPCPIVELVHGVEWIDPVNNPNVIRASCSDMFSSSIATVASIKRVAKNTQILIRVKGVKNPSQEGWTPYFRIETNNQDGYIIDRDVVIPPVYITRKMDVRSIIFNHFYTSPQNGNLRANYYLSFYPQTTIPEDGTIVIVFPPAEFTVASYPAKRFCRTGGSLATIKTCVYDTTKAAVTITLDKRLLVEPGMQPVTVKFPHILNFNPELTSGVVRVTTFYDSIMLDESPKDEVNRKAFTVKISKPLTVNSFTYSPQEEGSIATYTWSITVTEDASSGTILFEFPYEFSRELGDHLICRSSRIKLNQGAVP